MLYLKIPIKEISKSNNSETFWTIKPILIRKLKDTSINNNDIIKWKENTFQVSYIQIFPTINDVLDNINFKNFNVGLSKSTTIKYYRNLYGKLAPSRWVLMVLQLKKI